MNLQQFAFANSLSEARELVVPFLREANFCESIHRSECTQMELLSSLPVRKKVEMFFSLIQFGCFRAVSAGKPGHWNFSDKT